jgi:hypothetical protein
MIDYYKYSYKINNRKTSRRKKIYISPSYNVDDIYIFYKETYVNGSAKKKEFNVDRLLFKTIQYEYNKVFSQLVLKGQQIKIPYALGEIGIRKRKINFNNLKGLEPNWALYNLTGEKSYYFNNDNYWKARWYWSRKGCKIDNHRYYSFTRTRSNKNKLTKIMQTKYGYTNYFSSRT